MARKTYSEETKAAVMAALLSGQSQYSDRKRRMAADLQLRDLG